MSIIVGSFFTYYIVFTKDVSHSGPDPWGFVQKPNCLWMNINAFSIQNFIKHNFVPSHENFDHPANCVCLLGGIWSFLWKFLKWLGFWNFQRTLQMHKTKQSKPTFISGLKISLNSKDLHQLWLASKLSNFIFQSIFIQNQR